MVVFFTRDDVCHTWDQLQVHGANTRSWAEAHLQQEVRAVTTFSCTQQNRCKAGHQMENMTMKYKEKG